MDAQGRRRKVNVRFTPERIMVALGLADPTDRTAGDVARDKEIARLATLCVRAQEASDGEKGDKARAAYRRQLERCNERYGLSTDPKLMGQLQRSLALFYGSLESTTADAVAAANPWARAPRTSTPSQVTSNSANRTPQAGPRKADQGARERVSAEELLARYDALKAANPGATETWIAEELGVKPQRVRQVKAQFGRSSSTSE
jgi:hypothetical protein